MNSIIELARDEGCMDQKKIKALWKDIRSELHIKDEEEMINNYEELYLKTKRWQDTRELVLKLKGRTCMDCGVQEGYKCCKKTKWETKIEVHHLTYSHLGAFDEWKVCIPLCRICHKKRHGIRTLTTTCNYCGKVLK
jgi:5-methylcytosine-specific restriction endonuclease McrA